MRGVKSLVACFFLCTFYFLYTETLSAQSTSTPYYNFKNYTINDGLSSNRVVYTCKDSRGFLWIGTDRGLQRYNGSSFLSFRHINNDSTSLADDNIQFITEDRHHDIWAATLKGATKFSYKNGRFTNYTYGLHGRRYEPIVDNFWLYEDSRGRMWAGARTGLYLLDTINNRFVNYPPVNIPGFNENHFVRVGCIQETADQEIVFTVIDGFVTIDKNGRQQYFHVPEPSKRPINHLPVGQVFLLKEHPDEIWVTPNLNGLFKYERSLDKWTNYAAEGPVKQDYVKGCLEWDKDTWLLGGNCSFLFNHRKGIVTTIFDKNKTVEGVAFCKEPNGNIWFSTLSKGLALLRLPEQLFSSTELIPGHYSDKIFYYDTSANALYGMNIYFSSGIVKLGLDNHLVSGDSIAAFKPFVTILNDFIASDDILYLAMEKGLWQYNLRNHRLDSIAFTDANGYSSQQAFFFNLCRSGSKIYVTGRFGKGGPFVYDKLSHTVTDLALPYQFANSTGTDTYQPAYSPGPATAHGQVNAKDLPLVYKGQHEPKVYSFCLTMHQAILYAGMNAFDSLYTYNENTGTKKGIPFPRAYTNGKPVSVLSLCTDKKQNLWCGTAGNGIFVYNIPAAQWIKHISQGDGYFPLMTSQIVVDSEGMVWCNTTEGLFLFNPDNFRFRKYGSADGLGSERSAGTLMVLPGHTLIFNNVDKRLYDWTFGIINTKPADTTVQSIPISISDLKVMGESFLTDTLLDNMEAITLFPYQNSFSLSYAGVSLTEGKNLLYSYQLEDIETTWHNAGTEHVLSYINLSPGKYKLHIKCKSRNETIVGAERILFITVLPAWYQTWWFKLLVIAITALVIFFAISYYLRQQLKKQQAIIEKQKALEHERLRIAADMHDDVGAGLSRIRYITAAMKDGNALSNADMDKILSLSDESVEKMNEIIWSLNQGNQQLAELVYQVRSQCAAMVSNANILFTCELPEKIPAINMDWSRSRNVYMLVKEAVNNAVKHAAATAISIDFLFTKKFTITITDNGKGFNTAIARKEGNGLKNYEKRIAALNGVYHINTIDNGGTQVVFTIPLNAS